MFYVEHNEALLHEMHTLDQRVAILSQFLLKRFAQPDDKLFLQQIVKEEAMVSQSEAAQQHRLRNIFRK